MSDVEKSLKDAAYVTIGLAVIGFQKAQVRRQELTKQVETQLASTGEQILKLQESFEDRLDPVLDQISEQLPKEARGLVDQARSAARDAQHQFWGRVIRTNGTQGPAPTTA